MKWFAGLLALLMWTAGAASDQQEIEQATTHLLTSFENLDMPAFLACFADDATAFFPAPEPPERVTGKAAIPVAFNWSSTRSAKARAPGRRIIGSSRRICRSNRSVPRRQWCHFICGTASASHGARW